MKSTSPARFCYAITHLEIQWLKMIATTVLCLTVMMEVDQTQLGNNYLAPVCCCVPVLMECRRNVLSKPSFFPQADLSWVFLIHTCTFSFTFSQDTQLPRGNILKSGQKHSLREPMSYDIIFIRVAVMPKFKGGLAHLSIIGEAMSNHKNTWDMMYFG